MNDFLDSMLKQFQSGELLGIIGTTLTMSLLSTAISAVLAVPLGLLIGSREFRGKRTVMRIISTLMGLPPVVAGLVVFLLLSRRGPLGSLNLLFSLPAMVIAQVVLITPIITGLTAAHVSVRANLVLETTRGLSISGVRELKLLWHECRGQLVSVMLAGFGRAISEVGAVQIVGGNVAGKTRVMTTAIMLETNMGNFEFAVALGVLLLLISFVINYFAHRLQEGFND